MVAQQKIDMLVEKYEDTQDKNDCRSWGWRKKGKQIKLSTSYKLFKKIISQQTKSVQRLAIQKYPVGLDVQKSPLGLDFQKSAQGLDVQKNAQGWMFKILPRGLMLDILIGAQ